MKYNLLLFYVALVVSATNSSKDKSTVTTAISGSGSINGKIPIKAALKPFPLYYDQTITVETLPRLYLILSYRKILTIGIKPFNLSPKERF